MFDYIILLFPYQYIEFQSDMNHVQCGQVWHLSLELLQTVSTPLPKNFSHHPIISEGGVESVENSTED
ncbi:hypothetical protein LBYZC6_38600 [Lacrimispora brassicae]